MLYDCGVEENKLVLEPETAGGGIYHVATIPDGVTIVSGSAVVVRYDEILGRVVLSWEPAGPNSEPSA